MARTLYLQGLAKLAGLPFDLGDAAELALLFSENAGLQIDHLPIATSATINHGTHLITHPPALRAPIRDAPLDPQHRCSRR